MTKAHHDHSPAVHNAGKVSSRRGMRFNYIRGQSSRGVAPIRWRRVFA